MCVYITQKYWKQMFNKPQNFLTPLLCTNLEKPKTETPLRLSWLPGMTECFSNFYLICIMRIYDNASIWRLMLNHDVWSVLLLQLDANLFIYLPVWFYFLWLCNPFYPSDIESEISFLPSILTDEEWDRDKEMTNDWLFSLPY